MGSFVSDMELRELISLAQSSDHDDSAAMFEVLRRFERLAIRIASLVCEIIDLRDDIANAARLGLVRAVRRHDGQAGFPAYARKFMIGAALRALREHRGDETWRRTNVRPSEEIIDLLESRRHSGKAVGWSDNPTSSAVFTLPTRQSLLLSQRYVEDLSMSDIARLSNTSVSAVSQRLDTAHRAVAVALSAS